MSGIDSFEYGSSTYYDALQELRDMLKNGMENAKAFYKEKISPMLSDFAAGAGEFAGKVGSGIVAGTKAVGRGIVTGAKVVGNKVSNLASAAWDKVQDSEAYQKAKREVEEWINNTPQKLAELQESLERKKAAFEEKLKQKAEKASQWWKETKVRFPRINRDREQGTNNILPAPIKPERPVRPLPVKPEKPEINLEQVLADANRPNKKPLRAMLQDGFDFFKEQVGNIAESIKENRDKKNTYEYFMQIKWEPIKEGKDIVGAQPKRPAHRVAYEKWLNNPGDEAKPKTPPHIQKYIEFKEKQLNQEQQQETPQEIQQENDTPQYRPMRPIEEILPHINTPGAKNMPHISDITKDEPVRTGLDDRRILGEEPVAENAILKESLIPDDLVYRISVDKDLSSELTSAISDLNKAGGFSAIAYQRAIAVIKKIQAQIAQNKITTLPARGAEKPGMTNYSAGIEIDKPILGG